MRTLHQAVRRLTPLLSVTAVLLASCTQSTPASPTQPTAPTAAPAAPTAAKPAAAPSASAASPVASPASAQPAAKAPAEDWDQVLAAAKREGKVVVLGPAGADVRDSITLPFQKKYPDIEVDFSGPNPPQIPPKLTGERNAGQFTTDLVIVGTTTIVSTLKPAGVLDPIAPFLTGPDARDSSAWRGGKYDFADEEERYNLVAANRVQIPFVYNPSLVSASEFTSYTDLLNPKWKGKMAMLDPRLPGASQDIVTFIYTQPSMGKPFLDRLFAQEPTIAREDRQVLDWVAKGEYPLAIGPSGVQGYELKSRGVPLELFPGESFREGAFTTSSNATIAVVNRAPHPNAIKVYLNYLLSQEGQLEWSKGSGLASRRTDVPTNHIPDFLVPKPNVAYQENYKEKYLRYREELAEYLKFLPA